MDDLRERTLRWMERYQMLKNGDTVIVAFSGGGDSTALLRFLWEERQALGIRVLAAHVNHGLRGKASDEDEAFARGLCGEWGVPFFLCRLSPPESPGEDWARRERYAFLENLARSRSARIATAHTRDDQAETVLFNLARGASVHGAAGIPPVRGTIVRPFLQASRDELREFLRARGLSWREDETNRGDRYARGRVRGRVLPQLEAAHPGAADALARFAGQMRQLSVWLEQEARTLLTQAREERDAYSLNALCSAPETVRGEALRVLILASGTKPEKTALCGRALALLEQGRGAVSLGDGIRLEASQGQLRLIRPEEERADLWVEPFRTGEIAAPAGAVLEIRCEKCENFKFSLKDEKKALKFYADYDKIKTHTHFRTRRTGDRFSPAGRGVTKPLKKWLSEAKLPPGRRETLPVLAEGSEILWAQGFGFAQCVQMTQATKTAVTIIVRQMEET